MPREFGLPSKFSCFPPILRFLLYKICGFWFINVEFTGHYIQEVAHVSGSMLFD